MIRRALFGLLVSLWASSASAGINCTLPFNLVNGTTADASQVMANYNALVACLASAANAGANTDITSLLGLTTPLNQVSGGSSWFNGGTSTGSANAQIVASLTPNNFSLTPGLFVSFIPGFQNTGPTTLNINGTGAIAVLRPTTSGLTTLAGGELVATQTAIAYYDGTQFQLMSAAPQALVAPCTAQDYMGVAIPSGYLLEDGSSVSRTTYSGLFSCLNYTSVSATTTGSSTSVAVANSALYQVGWSVGGANVTCNSTISSIPDGTHIVISNAAGSSGATTLSIGPNAQGDCSTTFTLPQLKGVFTAGVDGAGTITSAFCTNPATLGAFCGAQSTVLIQANMPSYTMTGIVSDPGHTHPVNFPSPDSLSSLNTGAGGAHQYYLGDGGVGLLGQLTATTAFTGIGVTVPTAGSNTPFSRLPPVRLVYKIIKF